MHTITTLVLLASVLGLSTVGVVTTANNASAQDPFDVTTEQTTDTATITVTLAKENATIIIPENGTIIEIPATNITEIDNDTIIIAPDNETITETPGNVTIIDPPPPEPCGCPAPGGNETAPEQPATIPPILIRPAPGQNITEVAPDDNVTIPMPPPDNVTTAAPEEPPLLPIPEPGDNATDVIIQEPGNVTIGEPQGNVTIGEPGNETGLTPTAMFGSIPMDTLKQG